MTSSNSPLPVGEGRVRGPERESLELLKVPVPVIATNLLDPFQLGRPALLVSVRSAAEARIAVAHGADIIDVKEPERGPLGRPDASVVHQVIAAVGESRPVTVACGDLRDLGTGGPSLLDGVRGAALAKFGFAGSAPRRHRSRSSLASWRQHFAALREVLPPETLPVPVIYGDAAAVDAPLPEEILDAAREGNCRAILIDTFDKSSGSLFEILAEADVAAIIARAHDQGHLVAVAGSLSAANACPRSDTYRRTSADGISPP